MKQIKIQDLLPLLKPGFVAMDANEIWYWYQEKPYVRNEIEFGNQFDMMCLTDGFDIAPFEGDWKDSLMECGQKGEANE